MFSLQNKGVLLMVFLYMFFFLFITSQARNMPKESTSTTTTTEGVDEKHVTATENLAPTSSIMGESVEKDQVPTDIITTKEEVDEKHVTGTEILAPPPLPPSTTSSSKTRKVVENGVSRIEKKDNQVPTGSITTKEVGKVHGDDDKMVARTENMDPTTAEDLNMMDYSAAQNKIPSHN